MNVDILKGIYIQGKLIETKTAEYYQVKEQLEAFKCRLSYLLEELRTCNDYIPISLYDGKFKRQRFGGDEFINGYRYILQFKDGHVNYLKIVTNEYYDKWYNEFEDGVKECAEDVIGYFPIPMEG